MYGIATTPHPWWKITLIMALPDTYRELRELYLADLRRWDTRTARDRARNTQDKAGWDTILSFNADGSVSQEVTGQMRALFWCHYTHDT